MTIEERLSRVTKVDGPLPDPCWIWNLYKDRNGYGTVWYMGKTRCAHVVSHLVFVGEIPDGLEVDHLCKNRSCINPAHLEAVTREENVRRAFWASRENCPKCGNPFDAIRYKNGKPCGRRCLPCKRISDNQRALLNVDKKSEYDRLRRIKIKNGLIQNNRSNRTAASPNGG